MGRDITGSNLEKRIIATNEAYQSRGWAVVQKVATPWLVRYDRKTRSSKAIPGAKSTVDFIGVAKGIPIAFDAKSTTIKTRLPLGNIKPHQVRFLQQYKKQGGKAFFLVEFSRQQEMYILSIDSLLPFWQQHVAGEKHSIPYDWFNRNSCYVKPERGVFADYLNALQIV